MTLLEPQMAINIALAYQHGGQQNTIRHALFPFLMVPQFPLRLTGYCGISDKLVIVCMMNHQNYEFYVELTEIACTVGLTEEY
jgi:hypothetical protein